MHEFAPKRHEACVLVCVLDEGERITRQLERMQPYCEEADIIIIDGGSTDGATAPEALTGRVRSLLVKTDAQRGLSVQLRVGLAYALEQGYAQIVSIDGNGKDGVEAIPVFIDALRTGYDFVQGSRFRKGGGHANTPLDRLLGIRLVFSPIMSLGARYWYTDAMNGFKGVRGDVLRDKRVQPLRDVFQCYNLQYYLNYRLPRIGARVREIPVRRDYPDNGEVPSKIKGVGKRFDIMKELLCTVIGSYNPR